MEDDQWEKVQNARRPWGALKSRITGDWVYWLARLDVELRTWLHGERVVYAEYGCSLEGAPYRGDALTADGLWAVVFTERYVAKVTVSKRSGSEDAQSTDVAVVGRSAIQTLALEVVESPGAQGVPIVTRVSYEGIPGEIQIPADEARWFHVDPEVRLQLFAGLRDDMWLQES